MKLKKILKKIKRLIIVFFSLAFLYVMNEYIFPFLLNERLIDILKKIDPIYYVLILCFANVIFSAFLFTKIRKLLKSSRSEMYIGFSKVTEEESESLKSEHKSILEYLIQQDNYTAYRKNLWESFREQHPDRSKLEFSINLKEMQRLGYIIQNESKWGLVVRITDKACEILPELSQ